jgi:hypothetical protein
MTSQTWIRISSSIACATLLAVPLLPQSNPSGAQPGNPDIAGLPAAGGIYYRAASGWVALPFTVLMPFEEGRSVALQILNVGSDHAIEAMPGPHASVQISNDTRPTFYLRGVTPTQLYLVRAVPKVEYRELRMAISSHFREWAHFRAEDIANIELQSVAADVVTVKPLAGLKPGEYALASVTEPGSHWIRLGYDFGLAAGGTRK